MSDQANTVHDPFAALLSVAAYTQQMRSTFAPILQSAAEHRDECIAAGFSPTAAEEMGSTFYRTLIAILLHQLTTVVPK